VGQNVFVYYFTEQVHSNSGEGLLV